MTAHTLFEVRDGVAELTLNRPERMNAWTAQMASEIAEHFERVDRDDSIRAVVVTGAGRAFCAGADLERGGDTFDGAGNREARPAKKPLEPWEIRKPIIAAINGSAVGVGLTLPLQYDLRIVASDAKLGFLFVQRGVVPELSSTWIVPRLVGIAHAADLMLSGRIFLGEEAARIGLMNEAVPREQVLTRAREVARYIAQNAAPVSVALTKQMIWEHLGGPPPVEVAKREAKALFQLGKLADAREGVTAFLEKRAPRFTLSPTKDLPSLLPLE